MKRSLKLCFYEVLIFVFALGVLFQVVPTPKALAANDYIDSSDSNSAISNSAQRKTFYDTVYRKNWAFYYTGNAIRYTYTSDREHWLTVSELPYDTADFSLTYKVISGVPYVFLAVVDNDYDIVVIRGTVGSTSISFNSKATVFDGTCSSNKYSDPSIALSEENFVWLAAVKNFGPSQADHLQAFTSRSTNLATGDLSFWSVARSVGRKSNQLHELVILPRTGFYMYLLVNADNPSIVGYEYDGSSWSAANTGGDYSWFSFPGGLNWHAHALAMFQGDLYVGGDFTDAGGLQGASYLARWDGSAWYKVGTGSPINNTVRAMVANDGVLYVGGDFTDAGGVAGASYVAQWNGTAWDSVDNLGVAQLNGKVNALDIWGRYLLVGGEFTNAGGVTGADYLASYDLTSDIWAAVGDQVANDINDVVYAIHANYPSWFYVGGEFTDVGGTVNRDYIALYNEGVGWQTVGTEGDINNFVRAISTYGDQVWIGGDFTNVAGDANIDYLAYYSSSWQRPGEATFTSPVYTLAPDALGMYAGGDFYNIGSDERADYIAYYNSLTRSWGNVGNGASSSVYCLLKDNDTLYTGGYFFSVGDDIPATMIAQFKDSAWQALGDGINLEVEDVEVHDSKVYVGGGFINAGGNPYADGIAYWDGSDWHGLGKGVSGTVEAIAVDSDDNVYVGGSFYVSDNAKLRNFAKWDGHQWNYVGDKIGSTVYDIAISPISGDIYIGGSFDNVADLPGADHLAFWDGSTWNALDDPLAPEITDTVNRVYITGSFIFIGGSFTNAGGHAGIDYAAMWNGVDDWVPVGAAGDLNGAVNDFEVVGPSIYICGDFTNAGGNADADYIASFNTVWNELGTGLDGTCRDILIDDGTVVAVGDFTTAGGTAVDRAATWVSAGWSPLGYGANYDINAVDGDLNNLYLGGDFTSSGDATKRGSHHFAKYALSVTDYADEDTEMSATSDSNGYIYMTYTDNADGVWTKYYNGTTWSADTIVRLAAGAPTSPSISIDDVTNYLYIFWIEGDTSYYRSSPYPYTSWATGPTTLYAVASSAVKTPAISKGGFISALTLYGTKLPHNLISDFVKTDNTAPTGSVKINNGASRTSSRRVRLYLSASDSNSGVYQMRFKNSGGSWSTWKTYSTRYWWNLTSSKGTKTVYVQFKDRAENTSSTKHDHIIYR